VRTRALVFAALVGGCSKKGTDPGELATAWRKAAEAGDAQGVVALFDKASRDRLGLVAAKIQAAAHEDETFATLAKSCLGADPQQPPDRLVVALVASQLAHEKVVDTPITREGSDARAGDIRLHLEDGAWRAEVKAAGFVTDKGALCLTLVLPWSSGPYVPPPPAHELATAVSRDELERRVLARHLPPALGGEAVANDGPNHYMTSQIKTGMTTMVRLDDTNTNLSPVRWLERFQVVPAADGKLAYRWERTQFNAQRAGKLEVIALAPGDIPGIALEYTEKDPAGGVPLGSRPEDARDNIALPPGKTVHDQLVGVVIDAAKAEELDAAIKRAVELAKLDPLAAAQLHHLAVVARNRLSSKTGASIDDITLDPTTVFEIDPLGATPGLKVQLASFNHDRDLVEQKPLIQAQFAPL
jgi:hypothetical protein